MTSKLTLKEYSRICLSIVFTLGGLFLPAPARANLNCESLFSKNEIQDNNLPPEAKRFWDQIGSDLKSALDYDFQRPANRKIYAEQIALNHPVVDFYKSLGFQLLPEGTFRTPPLRKLLRNLNMLVGTLNERLSESGADFKIIPKMFLEIENTGFDQKQSVILDPLQNFRADGIKLVAKSNILKTESFYNFVAAGGFPIGGIENASGLSRTLVEIDKVRPEPSMTSKPNISDFLHDLSHLAAFVRNPDFAKAFIRVFRHHVGKMKKLTEDQKNARIKELSTAGSLEWRRNFYFAEAAWIPKPNYENTFERWPVVKGLITNEKSLKHLELTETLKTVDRTKLLNELREVRQQWWDLFDPLGGAVNDMISFDSFHPETRSNFLVLKMLRELDDYLNANENSAADNSQSLTLVLRFLKYSPKISIAKWEYFARSDDWDASQLFNILKEIYPEVEIRNSKDWEKLYRFLYVRS